MNRSRIAIWTAAALFGLCPAAEAATHEVRSCYDAIKLSGVPKPSVARELYILVDQTVIFNDALKQEIGKQIQDFLAPGDEVVLVSFSAYAKGRYTDIVLRGVIDRPLTSNQRFYIGKNILASFDKCLSDQTKGIRYLTGSDLQEIFANASEQFPNTELIGTLRLLSEQMAQTPASPPRYLLIASDMLEHSDITSFYANSQMRLIDADAELAKVKSAGLVADFGGAKVFVIGVGFSLKNAYQPTRNIEALKSFWERYFRASNASLDGFGVPSLVNPIAAKPGP